jgi:hypothetical protein
MQRKNLLLALAFVAAIGAAALITLAATKSTDEKADSPTYPSISFTRPASHPGSQVDKWQSQRLDQTQKDAGVLAVFRRNNPEASVLIRSQAGVVDPKLSFTKATADIVDSLESSLDSFKLSDTSTGTVSGVKFIRVQYQDRRSDKTTTQNVMVVMPVKTATYYLLYSTPEKSIDKFKSDIDAINADFVKYLEDNKLTV